MPCPHSGGSDRRSLLESRRGFLKAALAIGGTSALSACVEREGIVNVAQGPADPSELPDRQFAWNEYLPTGPHGNVKIPNHQLLLFLNYARDGPPTADDREQVAAAFRSMDRFYSWGAGGEFNPTSTRGLLSLVGYSPSYFDRFDGELPESVALPDPGAVLAELGESEEATPDDYDVLVVLSSDNVQVLLTVEQALFGGLDEVNGVEPEATLTGVLEKAGRRTGFLGVGRPADQLDVEGVSEKSPTAFGYRSGFSDNQASEDRVALESGPFADGTTAHISQLQFDLENWYDRDEERRVHQMFSPRHTPDEVGEIGEFLGGKSRIQEETVERTPEDAEQFDTVGHTQKVAAARDENFEPLILRRSEGVSTNTGQPGMNFFSIQREIADFVRTRKAMNGELFDDEYEVPEERDGILNHVTVLHRGNYLIPPRRLRALPTPRPA